MTRTIDNIWISSVEHLEEVNLIAKSNGWWRTMLGRNKMPVGFPQVRMGSRYIPVVFFAKGTLQLFERQIEFHPNRFEPVNGKEYKNLNIDFRFELQYDAFKLSAYSDPKPYMRSFNIDWIKLSAINNQFPDILLSFSGTRMNLIKKENETLNKLLRDKIRQPYFAQ